MLHLGATSARNCCVLRKEACYMLDQSLRSRVSPEGQNGGSEVTMVLHRSEGAMVHDAKSCSAGLHSERGQG